MELEDRDNAEKLKAWLRNIISGLVSHPDFIEIEKSEDSMGTLFTVRVHDNDQGKVIGKAGFIANAIRTVLRSAGRLIDIKASMKIDVGSSYKVRDDER